MPKKGNSGTRGPKKSQVAKARDIQRLIQTAEDRPKPPQRRLPRRTYTNGPRSEDGASLISSEERRVRLPLSQLYPKLVPTHVPSKNAAEPPITRSIVLNTSDGSPWNEMTIVVREGGHCSYGMVRLPVPTGISKKSFRFLDLPNEIQDMVFEHIIPPQRFHLCWFGGHRRTKTLTHMRDSGGPKLEGDVTTRRSRQQCRPGVARATMLSWVYTARSPVSTLWVNRQFYVRASRVFYRKSTFSFSYLGTLRHFLDTVSTTNKEAIRCLKLIHTPYGHPKETSDSGWKIVYDRSWSALCYRVTKEMPSIRVLDLVLRMNGTPLAFAPLDLRNLVYHHDFRTGWLKPLCLFKTYKLERCRVRIYSYVKVDTVLEVESWNLRRELMGDRWNEEREARRDPYGMDLAGEVRKGCRVLRIIL